LSSKLERSKEQGPKTKDKRTQGHKDARRQSRMGRQGRKKGRKKEADREGKVV
jgi:hypothetical protein